MKKVFVVILGILFASTAWAEDLYVKSARAKLMESPSFKAKVVERLQKGDLVEVKSRDKRWVEVVIDDKQGWVPNLLLSSTPPLESTSVLEDEGAESLKESARRRASVITTAGASRGLQGEGDRGDEATTANYDALQELEMMSVPQSEVEAFLEYLNTP